jgi:hypothetical protein
MKKASEKVELDDEIVYDDEAKNKVMVQADNKEKMIQKRVKNIDGEEEEEADDDDDDDDDDVTK